MRSYLYFLGDTIHLSDIDMIAGTPVLDIKPYIPEYDSPHTRMGTDQPQAPTVSLNETTDALNPHRDSETDAQSDLKSEKADDDDLGSPLSKDKCEADIPVTDTCGVRAQYSLPKDLHKVLEDAKAYVTQGDLFQLACESEDQVSPKTKPLELKVDHPCYGEEASSTIAAWIREPPVGSLEVRFTPRAERELAEFLPAHQSGKPNL